MADKTWAERLITEKEKLSRREQDLVDWITQSPQDAAFLKLNDLADGAGVSKPIVISCYRALGYSDYQDFQLGLQDFYAGQIDSYRASTAALKDIGSVGALMKACLEVEYAALETLRKHVETALVETMAQSILGSGTVYIYGDGTGFYPGHYLAQRLRSCGIRALLTGTDREHALEDLVPVARGDVFLSFYYTQDSAALERAMEFAANRGAEVLLITGFLEPKLCRHARQHLFVPRGQLNFKNSMAVPMAFAHVLLMAVELLGGEKLTRNLKQIEMCRKGTKNQ